MYHKIVASMEVDVEMDGESRTELDSHANMPVVRREALIVEQSGKMVEVSPFTPDYKPLKVEVVNAVVQYDSPLDGREYMLVIQNALCVPSMSNNLIPHSSCRKMELLSMNVPRYIVRIQLEKIMQLSLRDMASACHHSCMEYFHILSQESQMLSHLWMCMSH